MDDDPISATSETIDVVHDANSNAMSEDVLSMFSDATDAFFDPNDNDVCQDPISTSLEESSTHQALVELGQSDTMAKVFVLARNNP